MNLFNSVQLRKPKRNMIPLSFSNLLTTDFGRLTPCLCEECLPGDVFRPRTEVFTRFQPLMAPIMDRASISLHYFFVPSRILYHDFYKFMTGEDDEAVIPFTYLDDIYAALQYGQIQDITFVKSLVDYLNLPTDFTEHGKDYWPHIPINLLPFFAYFRIWYDYYRDENLQDDSEYSTLVGLIQSALDNGGYFDATDMRSLVWPFYRAYKKDYFTGALPWPQKGDDVLLPLQDSPITYRSDQSQTPPAIEQIAANYIGSTPTRDTKNFVGYSSGVGGKMFADNRSLAPTINDLRKSFRIQELLERNARGGTRPQEFILSHWGVNAKDARLQRPEYIGGSTTPIQISEVLSQSSSTNQDTTHLGQLGGHGISAGVSGAKKYRVTEHGYLMCILSVMPSASYFQGIPRMFSHLDRYDFFFPSLANIGEQEVKNKELYVALTENEGEVGDNDETFGYVPRYAEYKVHNNEIHGDFRESLYYWHLGRKFSSRPGLNKNFISVRGAGIHRIFTYPGNGKNSDPDKILVQLYHHNKAVRLMPYFGNPKF